MENTELTKIECTEQANKEAIVYKSPDYITTTIWNDNSLMEQAWKKANTLAASTIIPQQYRGKTGDCLIALDMANRIGLTPIMVMQSSQVVQGNFTWKGQACRALIDNCGKYKDSEYIEVGERGKDDWGYYMQAVERRTGKVIKGVTVTLDMAKKEGWYSKNGSKWQTMPELMFKYRAAAFFLRTECPDIGMGFLTAEEYGDINTIVVQDGEASITDLLEEEIK